MGEQTLVELEPVQSQRRIGRRDRSSEQLRKAELTDIAASETLVLATAMAQAVLTGLDMREKRKIQKLLLYIAGGLVILIGLTSWAMQFLRN
jgi:hypothetical protein